MQEQVMEPKDVIDPSWLDTYKRQRSALWTQLVTLNTNLFCLEKIEVFPFKLFAPIFSPFWWAAKNALIETSLMIIWRIAVDDTSGETLTLSQFKNNILRNIRKELHGERKKYKAALKSENFERTVSSLETQIREIRHNYLAHFNREQNVNPNLNQAFVSLSDLRNLLDALESLFRLLCFNQYHSLAYWDLENDQNVLASLGRQSDIEHLLDSVAKNSELLNLPENDPPYWPTHRKDLTPQELETLNEYRLKFGLPAT